MEEGRCPFRVLFGRWIQLSCFGHADWATITNLHWYRPLTGRNKVTFAWRRMTSWMKATGMIQFLRLRDNGGKRGVWIIRHTYVEQGLFPSLFHVWKKSSTRCSVPFWGATWGKSLTPKVSFRVSLLYTGVGQPKFWSTFPSRKICVTEDVEARNRKVPIRKGRNGSICLSSTGVTLRTHVEAIRNDHRHLYVPYFTWKIPTLATEFRFSVKSGVISNFRPPFPLLSRNFCQFYDFGSNMANDIAAKWRNRRSRPIPTCSCSSVISVIQDAVDEQGCEVTNYR